MLVACCLRVRAPAPVLAWVPLRSMGPVGPGRWSARHRSSPERSAMTRGPGSLVCAPRAAGLRTARCWSARCWPVQPGAEAALDAAVHWSVPVEPVAAHPCAVRAHRRRAAGLRAAGRWSPGCRGACSVSSPCATGFSRSYVKPRGRTQSSAVVLPALPVVRNSARSYLRAPLRYDRASPGTTTRSGVRPRRTPRHRTAGTRPLRPHPHTRRALKLLGSGTAVPPVAHGRVAVRSVRGTTAWPAREHPGGAGRAVGPGARHQYPMTASG